MSHDELKEALASIEDGLNTVSRIVNDGERVFVNSNSSHWDYFMPGNKLRVMGNVMSRLGTSIKAHQVDMGPALRRQAVNGEH